MLSYIWTGQLGEIDRKKARERGCNVQKNEGWNQTWAAAEESVSVGCCTCYTDKNNEKLILVQHIYSLLEKVRSALCCVHT